MTNQPQNSQAQTNSAKTPPKQQAKTAEKDKPRNTATGQEVAQRPIDQFKHQLSVALNGGIKSLLAPGISPEKFMSMVVSTIVRNPDLLNCERGSLLQAVADTAEMGLSLNPNMKEADILPVSVSGKMIAQMRPRAIGLMKLAKQSGDISKIWAHVVYENDEFYYQLGLNKDLQHKPPMDEEARGAMLQQAYCCWETKDGARDFEPIGPRRIARARDASQGYKAFKAGKIKSTPWTTDEEEMIRKTAVIAATKFMQKATASEKFMKAVAMATDADFEVQHAASTPFTEGNQTIIPPRPSRDQVRRQRDQAAAAAREMDRQYSATMGGPVGDDPPPHDDDGVVTDENGKADSPKNGQAPKKPADYKAMADKIMGTIFKAPTIEAINATVQDYSEDLNIMQAEAPDLYAKIKAALDGKREALGRRG